MRIISLIGTWYEGPNAEADGELHLAIEHDVVREVGDFDELVEDTELRLEDGFVRGWPDDQMSFRPEDGEMDKFPAAVTRTDNLPRL